MNGPVASLNTAWFALIGLLWTGYLVLEGFDFGVGVLSLAIGRDDLDRQLARDAIGPVWDGNEVWLIVAAGATFAAFPVWYASLFSGFYLVLFASIAGTYACSSAESATTTTMSMIGFATRPGTDVEPTCSIWQRRRRSTSRILSASRLKSSGHRGS